VIGADRAVAAASCAALARTDRRLLLLGEDDATLAGLDARLVQNELHDYRAFVTANRAVQLQPFLREWTEELSADLDMVVMFLPAVPALPGLLEGRETKPVLEATLVEPLELLGAVRSFLESVDPPSNRRPPLIVVGHSEALPVAPRPHQPLLSESWRSACAALAQSAAPFASVHVIWASGVWTEPAVLGLQQRAESSGRTFTEVLDAELSGSVASRDPAPENLVSDGAEPSPTSANGERRDATNPFELLGPGRLTSEHVAHALQSLLLPHSAHLSGTLLPLGGNLDHCDATPIGTKR